MTIHRQFNSKESRTVKYRKRYKQPEEIYTFVKIQRSTMRKKKRDVELCEILPPITAISKMRMCNIKVLALAVQKLLES